MDIRDERSSIDLRRDGENVTDLTGKMHQLPCCIKYNGPTSVSHYFKPKPSGETEVDGLRVEEAYFRGRKLHGTTIPLPQGYSGSILGKRSSDKIATSSSSNCWKTCATFENLTIWNHDAIPSKEDAFLRALHWFPIAQAVVFVNVAASTSHCRGYGIYMYRLGAAALNPEEPFTNRIAMHSCCAKALKVV